MRIMGFMKNDYHIDEDLFEIFVTSGVYKDYAEKYVAKNQIDDDHKRFCYLKRYLITWFHIYGALLNLHLPIISIVHFVEIAQKFNKKK